MKVSAHLVNRLGVSISGSGYEYVSTWPTLDSAMDEAFDLTNERNLGVNIIDRKTGAILVMYEGGQIIWRDKSTLPRQGRRIIMTIRERINYLEALEQVLDSIDHLIKGEMDIKRDDDGEWAKDEHGNYIYEEPDPEYRPGAYGRYHAYLKIKTDVEKLANK